MGKPFRNEFGWSITKRKDFETCKRLYWLNHYGMWMGWSKGAPPEARRAYTLKKMTNLPMLAGSIAHSGIEDMLRHQVKDPLEAHQERARTALRAAWRESLQGSWQADPKRAANLFEHYYQQNIPVERTNGALETVLGSLEMFHGSTWHHEALDAIDAGRLVEIEGFQHVSVNGVEVNLKLDLAIRAEDGHVDIYDWKTGRRRDEHEWQMHVYALYACERLRVEPERIRTRLVYLGDGETWEKEGSRETIEAAKERIAAEAREMRDLLADRRANRARKEDFPMTENKWRCLYCNHFESCYGTRQMPESARELIALQAT